MKLAISLLLAKFAFANLAAKCSAVKCSPVAFLSLFLLHN